VTVDVSPTTPGDVQRFLRQLPWRIRAMTAKVDGQIKGIGGVALLPDGTAIAFLEASEDDCKRYPLTLHRTAKKLFDDMKGRKIVAILDHEREAAPRWLARLGFAQHDDTVWVRWQV
jgi:hypothetical protein